MSSRLPLVRIALATLAFAAGPNLRAATYHVHPQDGDDSNAGTTATSPLRTLARASQLPLQSGDQLLLAAGQTFAGALVLGELEGTADRPIVVGSYALEPSADRAKEAPRATIDGRGRAQALWLRNVRHVHVRDLELRADAGGLAAGERGADMRCGVLVSTTQPGEFGGVMLERLWVRDVFFEQPGFRRGKDDVKTANGQGRYGWGVRFINQAGSTLKNVAVRDSTIENVGHTGLKFTSPTGGIQDVSVIGNRIQRTGGPGIQLSGVVRGHFRENRVDRSGSSDDPRKWGRGSGLWTWNCTGILIEHNAFTNARGPADSAGCHIDYNCRDVVVQYNLSARNEGGFCEILGNNFNCAYRYNISVDDGARMKGKEGAFQEGKVFWLSGYIGKQKPVGPTNSYIYNNTIFTRADLVANVAVAATADGVLVANNIFHLVGETRTVLGDQYRAEKAGPRPLGRVVFQNNLYVRAEAWPRTAPIQDAAPIIGDAQFRNPGGLELADYVPENAALIRDRGARIAPLPGDAVGLTVGLAVTHDILGRPIKGAPDLGAIELP